MTKSYNYIPTHFLYSSLLFFLLIFMYQQTHCHTLPKPFSKIFFFRIYVPTTYIHQPCLTLILPRPAFRSPQIPTPAQPANQSTNDTVHTHKHRYPHNHKFRAHTHHRYRAHPASTTTHNHTASTNTQPHRHPRDASQAPRRRRRRIAKRRHTPTLTHSQSDRPGIRQDQTGQDQAGLNQVRPGRTEPCQTPDRPNAGSDWTRPNRIRP